MKNIKNELLNFAYFPKLDDAIDYLANTLAEKESWNFSTRQNTRHPILRNYLDYTYRRLIEEKKVKYTKDNKFASFNTGLTTKNWEYIYTFFEANRLESSKTPFVFKAFVKKSDNRFLMHFSQDMPAPADYFQEPASLIFNPKNRIVPDIDHIIEDNINRFPEHLKRLDNRQLRQLLNGAIEEVQKRVKSNFKIAVPQYYHGRVQLLLPLLLTSGSPNPDLALVLNKVNDTTYSAETCLTIQMAYSNARLIVKPQSDWLKP